MSSPDEWSSGLADEAIDADEAREEYAAAFDTEMDPLAELSPIFHGLPDPFDYFIENSVRSRDTISDPDTYGSYERTYRQWRGFIRDTTDNRHPACPRKEHVKKFIWWQREIHGNTRRTIKGKLNRLSSAYEYWQENSVMPHPPEWNPFEIARKEVSLGENNEKKYYDLSIQDLRSEFSRITNIRRRGIIGTGLKQGLRAGEICNLMIPEIDISHHELQQHYPDMGTHPAIGDHRDVIYVPSDRDGNKSSNPRILPIDDELRFILIRHLIERPQVDEPWVFLSKRTFTKMTSQSVNEEWKKEFHPKYAETEERDPITSHYGRHWFSSYWRLNYGMDREHIQYMRGDRVQPLDEFPDAIDDYLHPKYELIESTYRENIFKLNIQLRHASLS